jgi:hypothetical protein
MWNQLRAATDRGRAAADAHDTTALTGTPTVARPALDNVVPLRPDKN